MVSHKQTNLLRTRKLLRQEPKIPYQILFQRLQVGNILQLGEVLVCIPNETDIRLLYHCFLGSPATYQKNYSEWGTPYVYLNCFVLGAMMEVQCDVIAS